MYRRHQAATIIQALSMRRVVLVEGPRQCGKSTLVQNLDLSSVEYRTLDDATLLAYASSDPVGFCQVKGVNTLIIDEVQRAPKHQCPRGAISS